MVWSLVAVQMLYVLVLALALASGIRSENTGDETKNIISFALYGNGARYTEGAIENALLTKTIYPGWIMRVYYDSSVPIGIISHLRTLDVELIDMTGQGIANRMSWRFLVASDPQVKRFLVRDIDSRLNPREKAAVDEWMSSDKKFHVMRDHPNHSWYKMGGGMWGATGDAVSDMEDLIKSAKANDNFWSDMTFLADFVWPRVLESNMQHDSYACVENGARPFPTRRIGGSHVGGVYINGRERQGDMDTVIEKPSPKECRTPGE